MVRKDKLTNNIKLKIEGASTLWTYYKHILHNIGSLLYFCIVFISNILLTIKIFHPFIVLCNWPSIQEVSKYNPGIRGYASNPMATQGNSGLCQQINKGYPRHPMAKPRDPRATPRIQGLTRDPRSTQGI